MHSRLSVLFATLLISSIPAAAQLKTESTEMIFTIQVASFPDLGVAEMYAAKLTAAGEQPLCDTVGIEGRGRWTRVFIGMFDTPQAAIQYGDALRTRGLITGFFIKRASQSLSLTRPRRVVFTGPKNQVLGGTATQEKTAVVLPQARPILNLPALPVTAPSRKKGTAISRRGLFVSSILASPNVAVLPVSKPPALQLAPEFDSSLIPRPDPVGLAFRLVTAEQRAGFLTPDNRSGLWLSGDIAEGLSRLRWIAGSGNAELVNVDSDGHVRLDKKLLASAAGLRESNVEDPLKALNYLTSNDGLLLLVQVTEGRFRYLLHVGRQAPTAGRAVETTGSINLDNNIDSRINPYRKNGKKLDEERPPHGFDSLIGLNPIARWFNLSTNSWVQGGEIVFHEIAEAHAKLEFGLDYLDQGLRLGAHATALQRETRLKSQRPDADIVVTIGSNRLLRTEEEIRLFYAETGGINQR
jgi:hypothetical protein